MKKRTLFFLLFILITSVFLTSCEKADIDTKPPSASQTEPTDTLPATVAPPTDEADTPDTTLPAVSTEPAPLLPAFGVVSDDGRKDYSLITELSPSFIPEKDIACLGFMPISSERDKSDHYIESYNKAYAEFPQLSDYKIGYKIDYSVNSGESKSILISSPKDSFSAASGYFEIWIYDDYHQTLGVWYSHLTESTFNDDSIITSVKLTAKSDISDISSLSISAYLFESNKDFSPDSAIEISQFTIK